MQQRKMSGVTVIELLIVVIIIAILAVIALPQFLNAQDRAKQASTVSNLRTLSTGIMLYQTDTSALPGSVGNNEAADLSELVPGYLPAINGQDAWGNDVRVDIGPSVTAVVNGVTVGGDDSSFAVRSPGKDGVFEGSSYVGGNTSTFGDDIVSINGHVVRAPVGVQVQDSTQAEP